MIKWARREERSHSVVDSSFKRQTFPKFHTLEYKWTRAKDASPKLPYATSTGYVESCHQALQPALLCHRPSLIYRQLSFSSWACPSICCHVHLGRSCPQAMPHWHGMSSSWAKLDTNRTSSAKFTEHHADCPQCCYPEGRQLCHSSRN